MDTPILTAQEKVDLDLLEKCVIVLRDYLMDTEEVNHLIEGEEYTDQKLSLCLLMALDAYNSIPPISLRATVQSFPSLNLFIEGGAIYALKSSVHKWIRNAFQYNDAGVQVSVEEKSAEYERTVQRLMTEWNANARAIKQSENLEGCYGGLNSEYLSLYVISRRTRKV